MTKWVQIVAYILACVEMFRSIMFAVDGDMHSSLYALGVVIIAVQTMNYAKSSEVYHKLNEKEANHNDDDDNKRNGGGTDRQRFA